MFLVRVILVFILISIVLRIIGRILFSVHGKQQNGQRSTYFEKKKEGSVTVMKNPDQKEKKKMVRKNEGEYVRYEEIQK